MVTDSGRYPALHLNSADGQTVQANMAFGDRHHRTLVHGICDQRPYALQKRRKRGPVQAFEPDADRRRSGGSAHGKLGVKVGIQRDADTLLAASVVEDVAVRLTGHADVAHVEHVPARVG